LPPNIWWSGRRLLRSCMRSPRSWNVTSTWPKLRM
jgi:hypothetical protein